MLNLESEKYFNQRVSQVEQRAENGQETLAEIESVAGKYDLIIDDTIKKFNKHQELKKTKNSQNLELWSTSCHQYLPRKHLVLVVQ